MKNKLNDIKHTGFKVPKDYFDSVEDAVFSQLKSENIAKTAKDSGFIMPEHYLDTIEDKVFSKIKDDESKVVSILSRRQLIYMSGVAAAVVLLFSFYFNKGDYNTSTELTTDMVETYIINQNMSSYELAALLTDDEISSINTDIMDEAFTDDEMEDYLIDNINLEDLIEQ